MDIQNMRVLDIERIARGLDCSFEADGDTIFCVHKDFTNFQESELYGIGETKREAFKNYLDRIMEKEENDTNN